jgi:hypothetical protein
MVRALQDTGYAGAIATEYVWVHVAGLDECDTLAETVLMRDRLRPLLSRAT